MSTMTLSRQPIIPQLSQRNTVEGNGYPIPFGSCASIANWNHHSGLDDGLRVPETSPWGPVTSATIRDHGIISTTTQTHGGILLSPARQMGMPKGLRINGGWYEEDQDCARVTLVYPKAFSSREYLHAYDDAAQNHGMLKSVLDHQILSGYADDMRQQMKAFQAKTASLPVAVSQITRGIPDAIQAEIQAESRIQGILGVAQSDQAFLVARTGKNLDQLDSEHHIAVVSNKSLREATACIDRPYRSGWRPPFIALTTENLNRLQGRILKPSESKKLDRIIDNIQVPGKYLRSP